MAPLFGFAGVRIRPTVACLAIWGMLAGGIYSAASAEEAATSLKINTPVGATDTQADAEPNSAEGQAPQNDAGAALGAQDNAKADVGAALVPPATKTDVKSAASGDVGAALAPPAAKTDVKSAASADVGAAPAPPAAKSDAKSAASGDARAAQAPPLQTNAVAPSPAAPSVPPEWHRAQMRLSGSMCVACLKELEGKLAKIAGVDRVRIQRPTVNYFSAYSPDVTAWAEGVVLYDLNALPLETLREAIRENGYHSYSVRDKMLEHQPDEHDLKF